MPELGFPLIIVHILAAGMCGGATPYEAVGVAALRRTREQDRSAAGIVGSGQHNWCRGTGPRQRGKSQWPTRMADLCYLCCLQSRRGFFLVVSAAGVLLRPSPFDTAVSRGAQRRNECWCTRPGRSPQPLRVSAGDRGGRRIHTRTRTSAECPRPLKVPCLFPGRSHYWRRSRPECF